MAWFDSITLKWVQILPTRCRYTARVQRVGTLSGFYVLCIRTDMWWIHEHATAKPSPCVFSLFLSKWRPGLNCLSITSGVFVENRLSFLDIWRWFPLSSLSIIWFGYELCHLSVSHLFLFHNYQGSKELDCLQFANRNPQFYWYSKTNKKRAAWDVVAACWEWLSR